MFKTRRLNTSLYKDLLNSFMSFRKYFNRLDTESPFILRSNDKAYFVPELNDKGKLMGMFVFDNSKEQQRFFYEFTYKLSLGEEILPSLFECFYVGFASEMSNREYTLARDYKITKKEYTDNLFVARRYSKEYPNRIISSKESKFIISEIYNLYVAIENLTLLNKEDLIMTFHNLNKLEFALLDAKYKEVSISSVNVNNLTYEVNYHHANEAILEDITEENTDKKALFLVNTFDVACKDIDDLEAYYTHAVFYIIEGAPGIDVEFLLNKPESFSEVIISLFIDSINKHGIPKELIVNSFLVEEIISDMANVLGITIKCELINSISDSYFLSLNETAKHFSSQIINFPKVQFIERQFYNVVFDALKEMATISQMIFSNMKDKSLSVDDVKNLIEDINEDLPGSNIKIEAKEVSKEEYDKLKKKELLLNAFQIDNDENESILNDDNLLDEEDDEFFNPDNTKFNTNIVS